MTTHTRPTPATGQVRDNTDILALQAEASALITDLAVVLARVQTFWDRRPDDVLVGVYGPEARRARNELVRLETIDQVEERLLAAAPGANEVLARLEADLPATDNVVLDLPVSIYAGG